MRMMIGVFLALLPTLLAAETFRTEAPSEMDRRFMETQIEELNEIASLEFGRRINGTKWNDLEVLQRLLDQGLVKKHETARLQGMGIVIGELLRKEKGLYWTIYTDKLGRSRALEIPGKREFVFPVTMISRRVEAGVDVKVREVYENAVKLIDEIQDKRGWQ
ncbi:hypothetical protein FHR99_002325 [Litorivivens lipolytica]|uniref:DUF3806 domain-containing protein n=1 Tax=Litorivivens lipolytica TaxID=1524264 RepID=A0A7W4W6Y7_9GAMM|nr:DUF3806 domain-containing protein [Litorivivens lipolytica]MBB3048059.1 hypothetical protein [Litorivivens lipolytica]